MRHSCILISALIVFSQCNSQTKPENIRTVQQGVDSSNNGPSYLPKPHATRSSMNFSKVLGWSGNNAPQAPEGFTVTAYGKDYKNPRWIYQLPNGDVLVAETKKEPKGPAKLLAAVSGQSRSESAGSGGNRIIILRDNNKDGVPDVQKVFLDSLYMPFGMLLLGNYFYVASTDALIRFPYKAGQTEIVATGEKVLSLSEGARHWTKNIVANKAGTKIYVAVGSASDHGEDGMDKEERRACILEINPDGSAEKLYGFGLRNPVGMDWHPVTNELWTVVNERDELGDDLVPDFLTSVKSAGFYGWPYSYFGNNKDPRISGNVSLV